MSEKTGIRIIPTFLVVALLGVGAWLVLPTVARIANSAQQVIVTVSFEPASRAGKAPAGRTLIDQVSIQFQVGSDITPTERTTKSPWIRTVYPNRGTKVTVWAEQFYGKSLSCSIVQRGQQLAFDTKTGPAQVSCVTGVL